MDEVLLVATLITPVVLGLVQVLKKTVAENQGWVRALPVVGLLIGIGVGAVAYPFTDLELVSRLWAGAIAGLAATGSYEALSNLTEGKDDRKW